MIRINLLPIRAARRRESIRQQILIGLIAIITSIAIMVFLQISVSRKVVALQKELSGVETEIARYKRLMRKVARIKKDKRTIEEKIRIIEQLEKNKKGPLFLLDRMSSLIPESAWLETLREKGGVVEIKGIASDNRTIADFMRRLEVSPNLEKVELVITRQIKKAGENLKSFTITFNIKGASSDRK